jgi:hypothetical protein
MKPEINLKKIIRTSILVLILLQIIPLLIYFYHFKGGLLSNNSSDWGSFADFYSGTLNPLLSAINIVILIIITLKVQRWDEERNEKSLDHQSNIFKNELKYNAYKEFLKIFESIIAELANFDEELPRRIMLKRFSLISLKSQNSHLFRTLGKEEKFVGEIADDISKLGVFLLKEIKEMKSIDDYDRIKGSIDAQFFSLISKYETLLNNLQGELNIEFD